MKKHTHIVAAALSLIFALSAPAQNAPSENPSPAEAEVRAVVQQVTTKLRAGQKSEEALAPEIQALDALVEKYREADGEDAPNIMMLKATLYLQVLEQPEMGFAVLEQLQMEFPSSRAAGSVDRIIQGEKERIEAQKAKLALVGQAAPEIAFDWATEDDLKSLSSLRGKVVVLDFWATWCGPCVASFPQIRELAKHYEGYDVEIVGVTSLQGRVHGLQAQPIDCRNDPDKERGLMPEYVKKHDINWTIAFSSQPVFNPEFGVTGIPHMAIVAPDGTVRHNGLHPGALSLPEKTQIIDALLKEAGLRIPPASS